MMSDEKLTTADKLVEYLNGRDFTFKSRNGTVTEHRTLLYHHVSELIKIAQEDFNKRVSEEIPDEYRWMFDITHELASTFVKKNRDYSGGGKGWLSNFSGGGLRGIYTRMDDKIHRLKTFLRTGKLENESFSDSCKDLAVYALILMRAQQVGLSVEGEDWTVKE